MRTALTALALAISVVPASAIARYDTKAYSCDQIQSLVQRDGAAILRYRSSRGALLYDRYVATGLQCAYNKRPIFRTVPTRDKAACGVTSCRDGGDPGG